MKPGIRKIIPSIVLCILLLAQAACSGTQPPASATNTSLPVPTEVFTPTFTPIPLYTVVKLVSNPIEESGKSPDYTVKAQVPFLQNSEDMRVVNFNNEMKQLTQEEIARFKDNVAQIQMVSGMAGSSYIQDYKLFSPSGNLVSLRFKIMIYVEGSAHPGTHSRTVTFDLEGGKDLLLEQMFLSGSDYLQTIANYCIAQLKTRDIGFEAFTGGADPLPANYGNWNITPDGLLITFDEYQVAAYAAGAQEVVIPYAELKSVIDPHGPLAGFLP